MNLVSVFLDVLEMRFVLSIHWSYLYTKDPNWYNRKTGFQSWKQQNTENHTNRN